MAKYVTTRPAKYLLRVLLRAKYLQVLLSVSIPSYLWFPLTSSHVQEVEVKDGEATVVITQPCLFAVDINGQMDDQVLF